MTDENTTTSKKRSSRSGFNAPGVSTNEDQTVVTIEGVEFVRESASTGREAGALTPTQQVLLEIEAERKAQDDRWGEQNHPILGGEAPEKARAYYAARAANWHRINDERVGKKALGWDSILLEEVYEAFEATDTASIREELVQVAAVAACAVERIDRLGGAE